jgi:hypothetical protein
MSDSPSPFATHADLSALRREIQLDVRGEMRDFTTEIRHTIRNMESKAVSGRQWIITTLLTVSNFAVTVYLTVRR